MQHTSLINSLPKIINSKIAILQTSWHKIHTDKMVNVCREILEGLGSNIEKHLIPGALELPIAAKTLLSASLDYDALICFGAIIKGETFHFELVAEGSIQGLMQVSLEYNRPIINEVLACYSLEQLAARSADDENNKGYEAADAAARIIDWRRQLAK